MVINKVFQEYNTTFMKFQQVIPKNLRTYEMVVSQYENFE